MLSHPGQPFLLLAAVFIAASVVLVVLDEFGASFPVFLAGFVLGAIGMRQVRRSL